MILHVNVIINFSHKFTQAHIGENKLSLDSSDISALTTTRASQPTQLAVSERFNRTKKMFFLLGLEF